jgi:hypothetical protein
MSHSRSPTRRRRGNGDRLIAIPRLDQRVVARHEVVLADLAHLRLLGRADVVGEGTAGAESAP